MKIINYLKNHYAIFVPIILIVILILTYGVYSIQKIYNNYSKEETKELYTFFAGSKVEDKFNVKTNRRGEIIEITPSKKINLNTIIYNKDKNKVIFPNNMTIIFVHNNYKQYKVNKYASLSYDSKNTTFKLQTTDYNKQIDNFVLYDGNDLYFFAQSSILNIDKEKINLSQMSYVIVNNNNSIEYYDSELDKIIVKDIKDKKITVTSNSYNINLNEDKIKKFNDYILLTNPSYLSNIK